MLSLKEKQIFQSLIDDWNKKSILQSSMCETLISFIAAIEIAKTNKEEYLPLLFVELKKDFRWSQAIYAVMEESPIIAQEDIGNVDKIVDAWLQFGKDKGIIK